MPELAAKMVPLVQKLALGLGDRPDTASGCHNTGCVEVVATCGGLLTDGDKIPGDTLHWVSSRAKALQLWMPCVAASTAEQYGLREQGLAPQRNEPDAVEMTGMEGPETHEIVQARQEPERR